MSQQSKTPSSAKQKKPGVFAEQEVEHRSKQEAKHDEKHKQLVSRPIGLEEACERFGQEAVHYRGGEEDVGRQIRAGSNQAHDHQIGRCDVEADESLEFVFADGGEAAYRQIRIGRSRRQGAGHQQGAGRGAVGEVQAKGG